MKGISPLVASVLLIAITLAVAAILANYVSTYTQETLGTLPTCVGGSMVYATADYPEWDESNSRIKAVIEAQFVPLGDFKFEVLLTNDTVITSDDTQGLSLSAGSTGTIISGNLGVTKNSINKVRVSTNCSNVFIAYRTLR